MQQSTKPEIKITCQAAENLSLDKLTPLQSNRLKTLKPQQFSEIRTSLLNEGFCAPFYVWKNGGKNYILDGHQRDKVLRHIRENNEAILPVDYPVVYVTAENRSEAARKLLLFSTNYGTLEHDGLNEFIQENGISWDEIESMMHFDQPFGNLSFVADMFTERNTTEEHLPEDDKIDIKEHTPEVKLSDVRVQVGTFAVLIPRDEYIRWMDENVVKKWKLNKKDVLNGIINRLGFEHER